MIVGHRREASTDTVVALYDADGELARRRRRRRRADSTSLLTYQVAETGTYYLARGRLQRQRTPPGRPVRLRQRSSAAPKRATTPWRSVSQQLDKDFYAVKLRSGDVLGGVANGGADGLHGVPRWTATQRVGSVGLDASSLYAPESPLPGGGNTAFAYVAEEPGWYSVQVDGADGGVRRAARGLPTRHRDQTSRAACRPCSSTSTASASTPASGAARAFVTCRRSRRSSRKWGLTRAQRGRS